MVLDDSFVALYCKVAKFRKGKGQLQWLVSKSSATKLVAMRLQINYSHRRPHNPQSTIRTIRAKNAAVMLACICVAIVAIGGAL